MWIEIIFFIPKPVGCFFVSIFIYAQNIIKVNLRPTCTLKFSRKILCNREQYLESFTDNTWNRVTALILRSKWSKRAKFCYIARAVYSVYILHIHPIIHKTQRNKLILLLLKRLYISFPFYQETFLMRRRTVEIKELYPLVATRDNVRCICTQNWKTFYQIFFSFIFHLNMWSLL